MSIAEDEESVASRGICGIHSVSRYHRCVSAEPAEPSSRCLPTAVASGRHLRVCVGYVGGSSASASITCRFTVRIAAHCARGLRPSFCNKVGRRQHYPVSIHLRYFLCYKQPARPRPMLPEQRPSRPPRRRRPMLPEDDTIYSLLHLTATNNSRAPAIREEKLGVSRKHNVSTFGKSCQWLPATATARHFAAAWSSCVECNFVPAVSIPPAAKKSSHAACTGNNTACWG